MVIDSCHSDDETLERQVAQILTSSRAGAINADIPTSSHSWTAAHDEDLSALKSHLELENPSTNRAEAEPKQIKAISPITAQHQVFECEARCGFEHSDKHRVIAHERLCLDGGYHISLDHFMASLPRFPRPSASGPDHHTPHTDGTPQFDWSPQQNAHTCTALPAVELNSALPLEAEQQVGHPKLQTAQEEAVSEPSHVTRAAG